MSKERLEDVRETMAYIEMCEKEMFNQEQADMAKCYLIERHGDWLIEQAERVQELEEQNKRYREALEFYAEPKNWLPQNEDALSLITMDYGNKARKVLEESK